MFNKDKITKQELLDSLIPIYDEMTSLQSKINSLRVIEEKQKVVIANLRELQVAFIQKKEKLRTKRPISDALDIFLDAIIEIRYKKRIENMEIVIPEWLITVIQSENPLVQRNPEENEFYCGNMILNYRGVWIKGIKNKANDAGSPVTISKKEVFAGWDEAMGFERD